MNKGKKMVGIMPSNDHNENQNYRVFFKNLSCNLSSYHKLPQHLLKISLLKLDGSLFDVCVARNATVGELKEAVEDIFRSSPEDGEAEISWSHVWGHFCLCHEEQKLLNDKVQIRNLGINDGDQLRFIQHLSINYNPAKQRPKKTSASSTHFSIPSLLRNADGRAKQTIINDTANFIRDDHFNLNFSKCDDDDNFQLPKFKLAHSLNNRLSYIKLKTSTRKRFLGKNSWSRF